MIINDIKIVDELFPTNVLDGFSLRANYIILTLGFCRKRKMQKR